MIAGPGYWEQRMYPGLTKDDLLLEIGNTIEVFSSTLLGLILKLR